MTVPTELNLSEQVPEKVPDTHLVLREQALSVTDPMSQQRFQNAISKRGNKQVNAVAVFSERVQKLDVTTTTNSSKKMIGRVEEMLSDASGSNWISRIWNQVSNSTAARITQLNKAIPGLQELKDECLRQEALLLVEQETIRERLLELQQEIMGFKALHHDLDKKNVDQAYDVYQHQQHLLTSYTLGLQGYAVVDIMLDSLRTTILSIDRIYSSTLTALRISNQAVNL